MPSKERISQSALPACSLTEALRLPQALVDQYAGRATKPLDLAIAVGVKPGSSNWRLLTGASVGYGLTEGAYNASTIGLTDLGRRTVAPQEEGEDLEARREACLKPTVVGGFLRKYDGNKFPRDEIATNVLRGEFRVPSQRVDRALSMIVENAQFIGAFREMSGDRYVSLTPLASRESTSRVPGDDTPEETEASAPPSPEADTPDPLPTPPLAGPFVKTIFIGHSKNTKVLEQVKQLLELADLRPEVATERETGAIPVPDKVFDAMRRSDAAIVCVTADAELAEDKSYRVNPNVLIEIGAAYVRYDKRLVLLWDRRVEVPSNLQGLYRCAFEGNELSWDAGTKLQKALIDIKKGNAPT